MECIIYRKDRSRPTVVREYLDEVYREPFKGQYGVVAGPWQTHTKRFHRHKTSIQSARLAFGFGGIFDQDEAERIVEGQPAAKHMGMAEIVEPAAPATLPDDSFKARLPKWQAAVNSGSDVEEIVKFARSKGRSPPSRSPPFARSSRRSNSRGRPSTRLRNSCAARQTPTHSTWPPT